MILSILVQIAVIIHVDARNPRSFEHFALPRLFKCSYVMF